MDLITTISGLSLKEKVGQLFFIGLPGAEIDEEAHELLEVIKPGGICLFSRNIKTAEQTRNLLNNLREVLPVSPFLSLDQEGGLVDRLRRIMTSTPSAQEFTKKGDLSIVSEMARITSETLRVLGFNMNFAPVVDVIDEVRDKYVNGLYSRGFGSSKEDVVRLTFQYIETLQENGCIGTIKHFPGYGATQTDSHEQLPFVNLTETELFETDLYPYFQLFSKSEIFAVMVGHAAYPLINLQVKDEQGRFLPSSLSGNFINLLLREKLRYDNLVLTDDLEMGAIMENYGIAEASKMALLAGNDCLLICADVGRMVTAFEAICAAFESGELSEERLNQSLERITRVKNRLSPPLEFDKNRLTQLSEDVKNLRDMC